MIFGEKNISRRYREQEASPFIRRKMFTKFPTKHEIPLLLNLNKVVKHDGLYIYAHKDETKKDQNMP